MSRMSSRVLWPKWYRRHECIRVSSWKSKTEKPGRFRAPVFTG
jgi:hypothetical protein